ncbi:MAG TPA: GntR family transcriptional regulator [Gaiellaceae bacterium]|jgi:DNA-binding GntR family transcriptional regulator|nr:GntR family transcriptional regulator [Gaiellaceae bacterium]
MAKATLAPRDGDAALFADRAYYAIRELIVTLELPPGAVVREPELTARLGIGRTPVREALRRLAQERLIEVYPRRGMHVTNVDVRELARLCEVRAALEPEAARLAAERATQVDLDEISQLLDDLRRARRRDDRVLIDLDRRIHEAVYRASHNQFLAETLEWYYTHALRIWMLGLDRTRLGDAVREHVPLLDAIRRGNGARAAELMRAHVERFEEEMRDALLDA